MRIAFALVLTLFLTVLSLDFSKALFFPLIKAQKALGGYGYGYGSRNSYNGHHTYRHSGGSKRQGRTYSDIARVINQDVYIPGGRFSPRQPFYPLGR